MVILSGLTLGEMLAVFSYLWLLMSPVQEILETRYSFFAASSSLSRINALLDLRPEAHRALAQNPFLSKRTIAIEARNLEFSYVAERPVLRGVNLKVEAGQRIGLIGPSGGGKSTLMQLLLGLYIPSGGEVLYDGIPQDRIALPVIRENVGYVLQHPALLNDTVRENLCLGKEVEDSKLWAALQMALLDEAVAAMPEQLDTRIGRHGARLSGGQRQRLAIARMALGDPRVLIFDEATSALDIETEDRLFQALGPLLAGRTTIILSHRLRTLSYVESVFLLEGGVLSPAKRSDYAAIRNRESRGPLYLEVPAEEAR